MSQANTATHPTKGDSHVTASWYSIRQKTPVASAASQSANTPAASAEIFIYGDIGESWWAETVTAAQFVKDLADIAATDITVRINSFGGSVPDGVAIYNALRRHPANITTAIDGVAMSVASLIAIGGDTVEMAENAIFMIHAPWTGVSGNSTDLRIAADMLDQFASAMANSYAAKTGKPVADMLALLSDGVDHYYTATEAQGMGFVDAIVTGLPVSASANLQAQAMSRFKPTSSVSLDAPAASNTPVASATSQPKEIATMTTPVNTDAAAVLAADQARRQGIRAAFQKFAAQEGVHALQLQCEDDTRMTVDAAGAKLLAHLGSQTTPVAGHTVVHTVKDEADKHREAMVQSVLARAAVKDKDGPIRADSANPYRGRKLLNLAESCLIRAGIKTEGMDQLKIVALAFTQSTSDFPILLENIMHKTLQSAYALQADSWTRFCNRGTVSDFRAHNRYRVGSLSTLDSKTELGEFKNKTIPDGEKASITAGTKGNIINISREAIINDDLGSFTGLATALGRAAKRTVEADVYATLALNSGMGPTLSDGVTLFHASHNNVSTGAPTVAAFDAARVILASQKDVSSNDFLALSPQVWLGPIGLEGAAKVVNNSTYDPDTANKLQRYNVASSMVSDILGTPRLSGTPWFMFADPSQAPVLEVAFLDGNDTPYLELQNGFEVDGAAWKVRLDYGVAGVDFRGAVRSTGV